MEQELLRYLLDAFPRPPNATLPDRDDDCLVIHGYRVPFEAPLDNVMLGILADFRRNGFGRDGMPSSSRG